MQTFLEYYQQKIQPQLTEIDVFLKTEEPPYAIDRVSALLDIPPEEGERLLTEEKVSLVTRGVFLHFMQRGSSPLCRMFRRELSCGSPQWYTPEQISYIYNLDIADVEGAAREMGESCFSAGTLPQLFRHILISDKQYQK